MNRTTMFRENKPLGHKHILHVDCVNDNQALIMQQRIGIVKIHEIIFKICGDRYVTSLEQIRYPIALSISSHNSSDTPGLAPLMNVLF